MFAHAVELAGRFSYSRLVAFDRATFDAATGPEEVVPPPKLAAQAGAPGGFRYVTLISCNPPYVRKYGFPFIRSFAAQGRGDSLLHLHIYDPDNTILGEVQEVISRSGLASYTVTTEASPFPAHETKQRKAYYACGRLVHLPAWLDQYACPVLSMAGRPERALLHAENAGALCRAAGSGVATRGEPGLLVAHRARVRSFARRSALPQIRPRRLSGTPAPVRCAPLNRACAQRGEKWFRARARRSRF